MKRTLSLISAVLMLMCTFAFSACDNKSQNAKLGLKAMDEGDYDRAKRLYNFAIEHGEADKEDKQIYDILVAYLDAATCYNTEDFAEGLDILDDCPYDYSSLSINEDMDALYNKLSDGKYAEERIKAMTGSVNAGDYEKARTMYEEIGKLSLTAAQQDELYSLSRKMTDATDTDEDAIYYKVNRDRDEDAPIYYEADSDSDIICRVDGQSKVEVISFAEGGFIEVRYDGHTGFMKASVLVPASSSYDSSEKKEDKKENNDKNDDKDKDKDSDSSESVSSKVPVEAISANDTLKAITGVNFRSAPDVEESEIIGVVPTGAEVTYLGEMEHGFYKIEYNGEIGYVYSDYMSK